MTVKAIYKNGVFVPETEVQLPEGAQVEVFTEEEWEARARASMAAFDALYPGCIGTMSHEVADQMRKDIEEAFEIVEEDRDFGTTF